MGDQTNEEFAASTVNREQPVDALMDVDAQLVDPQENDKEDQDGNRFTHLFDEKSGSADKQVRI